MSKDAASESQLATLHKKLAEVMRRTLDNYDRIEPIMDEIEEAIAADEDMTPKDIANLVARLPIVNPALLQVITKFLKDNDITCPADEDENMGSLEKRLAMKSRKTVGNITHINPDEDE